MKNTPQLIVMLTYNDKTVENAFDIFENCKDTRATYWGFKEQGLEHDRMKKLYKRMKECGKTTVMEVVAYEMRINMDALHEFGIVPKKLLATGGGSKSPVWVQIKSDVLGMPITVIDAPEVGTLGAIMITGCAVGTFTDLKAAAEIYIRMGKTYEPNAEKHAQYSEKYETYKKMYKLAKELR